VGLPRNQAAEPANLGGAVIIGIHDDAEPEALTTRPYAVSGQR
jgi:hypothetical protein